MHDTSPFDQAREASEASTWGRRRFLGALALAALPSASLVSALDQRRGQAATRARWSDPAAWPDGVVPGPSSIARVTKAIVLDRTVRVAGVVVERGASLAFDPERSLTLSSAGNVVVRGELAMTPASAQVQHRLFFPSIREADFVGGGMDVVPSDTGLWVIGGRLLLRGTRRTAWVRAARSLRAGDDTILLSSAPEGWRRGDELVVTPTGRPTDQKHFDRFDPVRVKSVSGRKVELDRSLRHAHPAVGVGLGLVAGAEVVNLTRNVRVDGSPDGRAHTWIKSCRKQVLAHASLSHFGPRRPTGKFTETVLGRYGLHFHMNERCSRGWLVEGVVARDGGSHAFVAHLSNGITFRSCVSWNTMETPFWYDVGSPGTNGPPSNNLLYDSCLAARVTYDPEFRGYTLSGFSLGAGSGNVARDCVAVGVQGNKNASGFFWPGNSQGVWTFDHCIAHNNKVSGIFVWQNRPMRHVVERFIAYHCGRTGVTHGAYRNLYRYTNCVLYGNGEVGFELHALASGKGQRLSGLLVDQAGLSPYAVRTMRHAQPGAAPTVVRGCTFRGYSSAAVAFLNLGPGSNRAPEYADLIDNSYAGNEVWVSSAVEPGGRIRLQDAARGAVRLAPSGGAGGTLEPGWNARVVPISRFSRSKPIVLRPITVAARSA